MKIYISGKITGLNLSHASQLFEEAEALLKERYSKYDVNPINPMKIKHKENATWEDYMKEDIGALLECDGIFMLKNWSDSRGARVEYAIARELKLPIFYE